MAIPAHLSSDLLGHFLMGPDHRNRLHCGKDPAPGIFLPIELCLEITLYLVLGLVKGSFGAHFLSLGLLVYAIKTQPIPQSLALDQHGWAGVSPAGRSFGNCWQELADPRPHLSTPFFAYHELSHGSLSPSSFLLSPCGSNDAQTSNVSRDASFSDRFWVEKKLVLRT